MREFLHQVRTAADSMRVRSTPPTNLQTCQTI